MKTTIAKFLLAISVLILLVAVSARADLGVNDPVGDFLPAFTGSHNGDLDVVHTRVSVIGTNFIFSATLNRTIGEASLPKDSRSAASARRVRVASITSASEGKRLRQLYRQSSLDSTPPLGI